MSIHRYHLPVVKSRCPVDGLTKRQYAKDLVKELNTAHRGQRKNVYCYIEWEISLALAGRVSITKK